MSAARLRGGEWLAAAGAIVLLASLLVLHWYGRALGDGWWSYAPRRPRRIYTYPAHGMFSAIGARSGWVAIPTLRWFVLATVALGLGLALAQAVCRGPALPVTLDLVGLLVAGLTTILLLVRLASTGAPLRFGAVLGLLACAAVTAGAYRAMRNEQGADPGDMARPIEVVTLAPGDLH